MLRGENGPLQQGGCVDLAAPTTPKGPCIQTVYTLAPKYLYRDYFKAIYTLAPKYLYRDYFKAKVYTIWVHGPLGYLKPNPPNPQSQPKGSP